MAQIVSRGATHPAQAAVVTVADLLNRNAPVPPGRPDDDAGRFVSVGSLLRREGRGPRSTPQPWPNPPAKPGRSYRRSAVAAGALLAVGSVFGAAALTETSPSETDDSRLDAYPGQGRLDPAGRAPAAQPVTVIDSAAVTGTLDPATSAPTSWMTVGFPGPQTPRSAPSAPGADDPGRSSGMAFAPPSATPPSAAIPAPAASPPAAAPGIAGPANAGKSLPAPAAAPAQTLGGAVADTGDTLGGTVNAVTEPVTTAVAPVAGGLLGGVGGLLGG